ncbi:regulatory protein RecX [Adlercreutzia murintestinalis]|uniref:regulatory protein RecX n=1 Tax=Adlercreutzia murintestinalis TaxID=2941325 RepID=UPI00203AD101|nr:RecX family transcriptional regulator [Adlercreutzia murintestinalis]
MEVDIETLGATEQQDAAFAKVLRCASAAEQSSLKMRKKLSDAGFSSDAIEFALQKAQRVGAIDDVRYAECLVRSHALAGKGMEFAKREVAALGLDIDDLEAYQAYQDAGEHAHIEAAYDILSRHPIRARDARAAAFRKLLAKGYRGDIASKAVSLWMEQRDNGV